MISYTPFEAKSYVSLRLQYLGGPTKTPATRNSILDQFEIHANIWFPSTHIIEFKGIGLQRSFHQHNQLEYIAFFLIPKEIFLSNHKN